MANLKECIYFYIYSEEYKGDGIYNCTKGYTQYDFKNTIELGLNNVKNATVKAYFASKEIIAYKYFPGEGALVGEYLDSRISKLKEAKKAQGEDYRGDENVKRGIEDIDLEHYYAVGVLNPSSTYLKTKPAINIDSEGVATFDLTSDTHKLDVVDQDLVFKNDVDIKKIAEHRNEFIELLRAFLYCRSKGGSLYIEVSENQYDLGKFYLESILKMFPISYANKVSFSTFFTGVNEDISLFFTPQEDEVMKFNDNYYDNVIVKIDGYAPACDGEYLSKHEFEDLLILADAKRVDEASFKQLLEIFTKRIAYINEIDSGDKLYNLLLAFAHLYDNTIDFTDVQGEVLKEIEFVDKNKVSLTSALKIEQDLVFKRLLKLLNDLLPLADTVSEYLFDQLLEIRFAYKIKELDTILYDLILCRKVKDGKFNIELLYAILKLKLSDAASDYLESYFRAYLIADFIDNYANYYAFIKKFLEDSGSSDTLLNLLANEIAINVTRSIKEKQCLGLLEILVRCHDKGFNVCFDKSIEEAKDTYIGNVIKFYLKFIQRYDDADLRNSYFEYVCTKLSDPAFFGVFYNELFNAKVVEQRQIYFAKAMDMSAPINDEDALAKSIRRINELVEAVEGGKIKESLFKDYHDLLISNPAYEKEKKISLSLIEKLHLDLFKDESLKLYETLKEAFNYFTDLKDQKSYQEALEKRYQEYIVAQESQKQKSELLLPRVDFIVDNYMTLGDVRMIEIAVRLVGQGKVDETLTDVEKPYQNNPVFMKRMRKVVTDFLLYGEDPDAKVKFAEDVRKVYEDDKRLTARMSFKGISKMVVGFIGLIAIFLLADVLASILIYWFVLKSGYVFLLGAVTLLNILAMSILYFKNMRMRMFASPFIRTLWQSILITGIMYATLYGALMLFIYLV